MEWLTWSSSNFLQESDEIEQLSAMGRGQGEQIK